MVCGACTQSDTSCTAIAMRRVCVRVSDLGSCSGTCSGDVSYLFRDTDRVTDRAADRSPVTESGDDLRISEHPPTQHTRRNEHSGGTFHMFRPLASEARATTDRDVSVGDHRKSPSVQADRRAATKGSEEI